MREKLHQHYEHIGRIASNGPNLLDDDDLLVIKIVFTAMRGFMKAGII